MNDMNNNKDSQEQQINIKTEFYTREGLWKLLQNLDYSKPSANINKTSNTQIIQPQQTQYYNDEVKISFVSIKNTTSIRCINCNRLNFISESDQNQQNCESCNRFLKFTDFTDYLLFNYSRELYLYHYNGLKEVCFELTLVH